MSKVAESRASMLDEAKAAAAKLTKRRLEDDGFDEHAAKEAKVNAEADAQVDEKAKKKS